MIDRPTKEEAIEENACRNAERRRMKAFTVKLYLETYGAIYISRGGVEVQNPVLMSHAEATRWAKKLGGFVAEVSA